MNLLVTAGPTREFVDDVRYLSNLSSGRMGYAVAAAGAAAGHKTVLVSGPTALSCPPGVERVEVESAEEMYRAIKDRWEWTEALVMAAAVADYRPAVRLSGKIKKGPREALGLDLVRTRDVLAELGRDKGKRVLVGFALETDGLLAEASRKLGQKNLDAVVANSLENLGSENASGSILLPDGKVERWTNLPKAEFGRRLVALVGQLGQRERLTGGGEAQ